MVSLGLGKPPSHDWVVNRPSCVLWLSPQAVWRSVQSRTTTSINTTVARITDSRKYRASRPGPRLPRMSVLTKGGIVSTAVQAGQVAKVNQLTGSLGRTNVQVYMDHLCLVCLACTLLYMQCCLAADQVHCHQQLGAETRTER